MNLNTSINPVSLSKLYKLGSPGPQSRGIQTSKRTIWIGEVVSPRLKGWSLLDWPQLYTEPIKRRPGRSRKPLHVAHSIAGAAVSEIWLQGARISGGVFPLGLMMDLIRPSAHLIGDSSGYCSNYRFVPCDQFPPFLAHSLTVRGWNLRGSHHHTVIPSFQGDVNPLSNISRSFSPCTHHILTL